MDTKALRYKNRDNNFIICPARRCFKDAERREPDMEFVEGEDVVGKTPEGKRQELELKLTKAVEDLANVLDKYEKNAKNNPAVANSVKIARARLEHAKAKMERLTDAQVKEILGGVRLSILSAKREEMAQKLVNLERLLNAERDAKIEALNRKMKELFALYKNNPSTLKYVREMCEGKNAVVTKMYLTQILKGRELFNTLMKNLSPDIDEVLEQFSSVDFDIDHLMKPGASDTSRQFSTTADDIIDLAGLDQQARGSFLFEQASAGPAYRNRMLAAVLNFQLVTYNAGKGNPESAYSKAEQLKNDMNAQFAVLDRQKSSPDEKAQKEAKLYAAFLNRFGDIRAMHDNKYEMSSVNDEDAVASYFSSREARPEGAKKSA